VTFPSLADAKTRWNRAGDHVTALNDACQAIMESGGYQFEPDCDMYGNGTINFRDRAHPELLRVTSTLFGEVVGNLWAARNYVVWHVACLRESAETPSNWKNLSFPIFKEEPGPTETFLGRSTGKLRGLDPADVVSIEAAQPYQTGTKDPVSGLRQADTSAGHHVLEELAILDRHRRLPVTALFPMFMQPDVKVLSGNVTISELKPDESKVGWPLVDGDAVATFRVTGSAPFEFAASPGAMVQIFPRDVVSPATGISFDAWVRRMQKAVADLIDDFAPVFSEDKLNFTPPAAGLWWPIPPVTTGP
jgi:hypothetical protein